MIDYDHHENFAEVKDYQNQIIQGLNDFNNLKKKHDEAVDRLSTNLKDQLREKLIAFFAKQMKSSAEEYSQEK